MGGHLDAFDVATGAVDNGSGVAPAMEAARLIMKVWRQTQANNSCLPLVLAKNLVFWAQPLGLRAIPIRWIKHLQCLTAMENNRSN